MAGKDQFLTPADVALRSGLSVKTVYRAIRSGALVVIQPTARYLIREADYQRWMSAPAKPPVPTAPSGIGAPAAPAECGSIEELRAIEREAA